ncbi:hypothetical protein ACI5KX_12740 [Erythrobacter sp. GH1-10]|uniref:hypothetical protein n=1 Tax=Erythrobacter sp. GH1-10 TaxID=3349334 RepID=UPI003877A825
MELIGRSRRKLRFKNGTEFRNAIDLQKNAIYQGPGGTNRRSTALNSIADQLDKISNTRKIEISAYLAALENLVFFCDVYLNSQSKLKKAQQKLKKNKSRSLEAVAGLKQDAAQRLTDINDSIDAYEARIQTMAKDPVRDPNLGVNSGRHFFRKAAGRALNEHELNELVMEDTRASFPDKNIQGSAAAATIRYQRRQAIDMSNAPGTGGQPATNKEKNDFRSDQLRKGGLWQIRRIIKTQPEFLIGNDKNPVTQLTYLRSQTDRDPYHITFEEGTNRVTKANGQPLHTGGEPGKFWIFAVDNATGDFYAMPGGRDTAHHSSFFAGMPVMCAGNIYAKNGRLISIDNGSGHYQPTADHLYDACLFLKHEWNVNLGSEENNNCVWAMIMQGDEKPTFVIPAAEYLNASHARPANRRFRNLAEGQNRLEELFDNA